MALAEAVCTLATRFTRILGTSVVVVTGVSVTRYATSGTVAHRAGLTHRRTMFAAPSRTVPVVVFSIVVFPIAVPVVLPIMVTTEAAHVASRPGPAVVAAERTTGVPAWDRDVQGSTIVRRPPHPFEGLAEFAALEDAVTAVRTMMPSPTLV